MILKLNKVLDCFKNFQQNISKTTWLIHKAFIKKSPYDKVAKPNHYFQLLLIYPDTNPSILVTAVILHQVLKEICKSKK